MKPNTTESGDKESKKDKPATAPLFNFDFSTASSSSSSSAGATTSSSLFNFNFSTSASSGSSLFGTFSSLTSSSSSSSSSVPSFNFNFGSSPSLTSTGFSLTSTLAGSSTSPIFGQNIAAPLKSASSSTSTDTLALKTEPSTITPLKPVDVVTGEEGERHVYTVRARLFGLDNTSKAWKERGVGQLHLNVSQESTQSRLVMRTEGILKLILNAPLFPSMVCERVQEKGVRISSFDNGQPSAYLLRVGRKEQAEELYDKIIEYKAKSPDLKTGGSLQDQATKDEDDDVKEETKPTEQKEDSSTPPFPAKEPESKDKAVEKESVSTTTPK
ncbi:E3 SUMO-protein ligase RanBP2 [Balamuthia mandrillaris]